MKSLSLIILASLMNIGWYSYAKESGLSGIKLKVKRNTVSFYLAPPGKLTANGDPYDRNKMRSAVHTKQYKSMLGKCYEVTGQDSKRAMCYDKKKVVVKINDNGPGVSIGGFDLTKGAFDKLMVDCPVDTQTRFSIVSRQVQCPENI